MFERFFMNRLLKSRITFLYILFAVAVVGIITFYAYYYTVGLLKVKEESILEDSIEYLESVNETRDMKKPFIAGCISGAVGALIRGIL